MFLSRNIYRIVCLFSLVSLIACGPENDEAQDDQAEAQDDQAWMGFVQLLANDPLRHTYDFLRDDFGSVIQEGEVRNAGSHLDYTRYHDGEFTVGIQGGEVGAILDLGTDDDLAASIGVEQTVGGGQGFAAVSLDGNSLNVDGAESLLGEPTEWLDESDHVVVELNHVYLLRIVDDAELDLMVKLLVVEVDENAQAVSFEWVRLR